MKKIPLVAIVLVLCIISFKVGDRVGYENGSRLGLECKENLSQLKAVVDKQNETIESLKISVQKYIGERESAEKKEKIRKLKKLEASGRLKDIYGGAIIGFDDNGEPIFDDERLKELAGLK